MQEDLVDCILTIVDSADANVKVLNLISANRVLTLEIPLIIDQKTDNESVLLRDLNIHKLS